MFQSVTLDDEFLTDIGLTDLSDEEKQQTLESIKVALDAKVGAKITQDLSDEQINQFNNIVASDDSTATLEWIEKNVPNYQDIVMQELDIIIEQIKHNNLMFVKRL